MPISLGDINFNITANSRDLESAMRAMTNFGNKVDKVARSQTEAAQKTAVALARQERAIASALQKTANLTTQLKNADAGRDAILRAEKAFNLYSNQLDKTKVKSLTLQRANTRLTASLNAIKREVSEAAAAKRKLAADTRANEKAQRDAARASEANAVKMRTLADAARELSRVQQQTSALNTGGNKGLAQLNDQFARDDLVRNYNRQLLNAGLTATQAAERTRAYSHALNALNVAQQKHIASNSKFNTILRDSLLIFTAAQGPIGLFAAQALAISDAFNNAGLTSNKFALVVGASTLAVAGLGSAIIRAGLTVDSIRAQFNSFTRDAALSNRLLEEARLIADKSGIAFSILAKQYARFTASTVGTSLAGRQARDTFETLAMVTGKLQLPAEQAEGVFRAVEQIMSKGKVQAEELRNQLGDRLPGAFKIAADAMGVTTAELSKMLEQGQVLSEEFIPKFTAQLEKVFDTTSSVDTLQASFGKLATANTLFLETLDQSLGLSTAFKASIDFLTASLNFLTANMQVLIPVVGALAASFIALRISTLITAFTSLAAIVGGVVVTAFRSAAAAVAVLTVAMLANPVGAVISLLIRLVAVIGTATAAYFGLSNALDTASSAMNQLTNETNSFINMSNRVGNVGGLGDTLEKSWITQIEKTQARISDLRHEIGQLENSPIRNALSEFTPVRGLADARKELIAQNELLATASKKLGELKMARLAANKSTASPVANTTGIGVGNIPKISTPKPAKISNTINEAAKMAEKLRRQREVLHTANTQISDLKLRLEALNSGGLPALKKLNDEFSKTKDLKDYAKLLKEAGLSTGEISKRITDLSTTQDAYNKKLDELLKKQKLVEEIRDSFTDAFDNIGDALGTMLAQGKLDFKSLVDVAKQSLAEISAAIFRQTVVNPIKQQIMNSIDLGQIADVFSSSIGTSSNSTSNNGTSTVNSQLFGSSFGAEFARQGTILNSPTTFPRGTGRPVIGGEAGSEALVPLSRMSNGDLGIKMQGGNTQPVNVTITTPSPEAFKRSKSQVSNSIRRILGYGAKNGMA